MIEWLSDLCGEPAEPCETCSMIRAAYRRGREDAANILNVAIGDNGPLFNHDKLGDVIAWWDSTVAAIRTDEREHAKTVIRELMQDPAVKGNKARIDVLLQAIININEAARGDGEGA